MPGIDVEQIRGLPDFPTLHQWSVSIPTPPSVAGDPAGLNVRMLTAELPKRTNEKIVVAMKEHEIGVPGKSNETHSLTLAFAETVDNYIASFLRSWREVVNASKTKTQQPTADVQTTILMHQLNRQKEEIWFYKVYGCWLEDYDPTGGEWGTDSEILRPTITLSYDWFNDGPGAGS